MPLLGDEDGDGCGGGGGEESSHVILHVEVKTCTSNFKTTVMSYLLGVEMKKKFSFYIVYIIVTTTLYNIFLISLKLHTGNFYVWFTI